MERITDRDIAEKIAIATLAFSNADSHIPQTA